MIKLLYYTTTYYLNKISYYYKDEYYSRSPKRDTFQTTPPSNEHLIEIHPKNGTRNQLPIVKLTTNLIHS